MILMFHSHANQGNKICLQIRSFWFSLVGVITMASWKEVQFFDAESNYSVKLMNNFFESSNKLFLLQESME